MLRTRTATLIALSVLAACGGGDEAPREPTEPATVPAQEVAVTVDDRSVEIEGSLTADPTTLTFTNDGKQPHQVYLARLNDGVTEADARSALKKSPDALFEMITVAGSLRGEGKNFARLSPGNTQELTIDFPEGTYLIIDPEVQGPPPFGFFEIGASSGEQVEEPSSDYALEVGEFYFKFDGVTAGEATVKITNSGEQGHEISVGSGIKSEDGEEAVFTFAPPPGGTLWTTFDLSPGKYEVVCFFPDTKTGKPHFKLGMEAEVTVE